jgi:chromosome segregation ATPase
MPRPTTRTIARRLAKSRLENKLAGVEQDLAQQKENLRQALCRENETDAALNKVNRELQTARFELGEARAELAWIAKHAIARAVGAARTHDGCMINLAPASI